MHVEAAHCGSAAPPYRAAAFKCSVTPRTLAFSAAALTGRQVQVNASSRNVRSFPPALWHQQCAGLRSRPAHRRSRTSATAAEQDTISIPEPQPIRDADGQPTAFPNAPGIYAVYDAQGELQYVGMSRKVAVSVGNHASDLPDKAHAVAVVPVTDASRDALTAAWTQTIQAAVAATGKVPPGNAKGNKEWTQRRQAVKPEIRLTPGKGIQDLSVPLETILSQVVQQNRVVAFIKGTRTAPECGFSHRVLTLLNESRAEYEVVNVLDDKHNPGLRETIKTFSDWPTIPQLYVDGEFVGGADIVNEMSEKGELKPLLTGSK